MPVAKLKETTTPGSWSNPHEVAKSCDTCECAPHRRRSERKSCDLKPLPPWPGRHPPKGYSALWHDRQQLDTHREKSVNTVHWLPLRAMPDRGPVKDRTSPPTPQRSPA